MKTSDIHFFKAVLLLIAGFMAAWWMPTCGVAIGVFAVYYFLLSAVASFKEDGGDHA